MKWTSLVVLALLSGLFLPRTLFGSEDTRGPNGINSAALSLTGTGVSIGQVEAQRPGKFGDGFDDGSHSNSSTIPKAVYILDGLTPNWNDDDELYDDTFNPPIAHATLVAGVMISTDAIATGIATGADLYASGVYGPTGPLDLFDRIAITAQFIATRDDDKVAAINFSFLVPFEVDHHYDGQSKVTKFVDWSAKKHDVLYVVGGYQTNTPANVAQPTDNFNGLTVGASSKDLLSGVYQRVADLNIYNQHPESNRWLVDIIAPGVDVELADIGGPDPPTVDQGTSLAAPHVTATVALLQEHANAQAPSARWGSNKSRHEVMKAVIMNSADKILDDGTAIPPGKDTPVPLGGLLGMERTVYKKPQDGNPNPTWFDSTAYDDTVFEQGAFVPLDDEMGVGHLNANRAFKQFQPGEWEAEDPMRDGIVPLIGWDLGETQGIGFGNIQRYHFAEDLLADSFVSITLVWDRVVSFQPLVNDLNNNGEFDAGEDFADYIQDPFEPQANSAINDLRLWLLPESASTTAGAIASSDFNEGTVEHLFFQIPETGRYKFWVEQVDADVTPKQEYGIAWWAVGVPSNVIGGDFNNDGMVDADDLAVWKTEFGTTRDGSDFLAWQRNYGAGVPASPTAGTVPEPSAWALATIGLPLLLRKRLT